MIYFCPGSFEYCLALIDLACLLVVLVPAVF